LWYSARREKQVGDAFVERIGRSARPPALADRPVYQWIRAILDSARAGVARSVNTTQVIANWLVGRTIVEEEQHGKKRAGYGEELLASLAERFCADGIAGYSLPSLRFMRQFFRVFPELIDPASIRYALRSESGPALVSITPAVRTFYWVGGVPTVSPFGGTPTYT
jgi:hypothetical protein